MLPRVDTAIYFQREGWDFSLKMLQKFREPDGSTYRMTDAEVDKVAATPEMQRLVSETIDADARTAVAAARRDPSLYGKPQEFKHGFTTTSGASGDSDIDNALGHYSWGMVSHITVDKPGPDGQSIAHVTYRLYVQDVYDFTVGGAGDRPGLTQQGNDAMARQQETGLARIFDIEGAQTMPTTTRTA